MTEAMAAVANTVLSSAVRITSMFLLLPTRVTLRWSVPVVPKLIRKSSKSEAHTSPHRCGTFAVLGSACLVGRIRNGRPQQVID
jgi:hypothetical protein